MKQRLFGSLFLIVVLGLSISLTPAQQNSSDAMRQEEEEDYFQKWLEEDVVYIISDEEEDVFSGLQTPEEKEQFIEQFWFRRDLDPRTANNEFKEEHYRRIAFANENFTSGDPGWLTDRGRIYIIHGPPANRETRPMGGAYVRKIQEGGGMTSVYPMETWTYQHIEGLGENIILEFVDKTESGKYELVVFDWEKDALLTYPGGGKTLAEQTGLATRADRSAIMPAQGGAMYGAQDMFRSMTDTPFRRYETYAKVNSVPIVKYQDLKELVEVDISFETLPFQLKQEYFKLNEAQVLVPITVQVQNSDLSFSAEGNLQVARVAVYGLVSSLSNRLITEFEDDFTVRYSPDNLMVGLNKKAVYQKILTLDQKNRYKVDLVVKDLNTGKTGILRQAIVPPSFKEEALESSSLLLSNDIEVMTDIPDDNPMFVLGDVKVLPNMDAVFTNEMPLGIYFQIYNASLDQSSLQPALRVTYSLFKDGQLLAAATDSNGESLQFFSGRRVVLTKKLSLVGLEPGKYKVQIEVVDELTSRSLTQEGAFTVESESEG